MAHLLSMKSRIVLLALPLALAAAGASATEPPKSAPKPAPSDARFDKYDADKNGVIDREEFKRLDADWHKARDGKTKVDTDADPIPDKGIRGQD